MFKWTSILYEFSCNKQAFLCEQTKGESNMINKEQLDLLYELKKEVEKSRNEALLHTINQVIKKVYCSNMHVRSLDIFLQVNRH